MQHLYSANFPTRQRRLFSLALPVRAALFLALFFPSQNLSAQSGPITFEARAEPQEVVAGNRFEVSFTLKNAEGLSFRAPDFQGFRVLSRSTVAGSGFTNGQAYMHRTWVFEVEAGPTPGQYAIGPATVVANGKALRTQPLTVRVVGARARPGGSTSTQAPGGSGDNNDVFVVGEFDRATAYIGQQLTYQIRLYTRVTVVNLDILEMPDFEGFYAQEKKRFDTTVQYETLQGKKYAVRILHESGLFPQQAGKLTAGAAKIRVALEQAGNPIASFLGRPLLLETKPATLTVEPLPEPAPANFTGGVGQYRWNVQPDRTTLTTDEALSLRVTLEGNGDARRFAPPIFAVPDGLEMAAPKTGEEEEYERDGAVLMHSKTLEYVILPKAPGDYTLVPELVFFDPDSARYRSLSAEAIHIHVTPGQAGPALPLPTDGSGDGAGFRFSLEGILRHPAFWVLVATGLFGLLLFVFLKGRRSDAPTVPRAPVVAPKAPGTTPAAAPQSPRERFAAAHRLLLHGQPSAFYQELHQALKAYLAARLGLAPGELTKDNVRLRLASRNVPESRIRGLLTIWQRCEQALFAGQVDHADMESIWRQADEVVAGLENDIGSN